jgi:hypothetical protein
MPPLAVMRSLGGSWLTPTHFSSTSGLSLVPPRKAALSAQYPGRYLHLRGLGNVNYRNREQGIQLYAPEKPLHQLCVLMERGYSLILLCACQNYASCHRRLVYDLLAASSRAGSSHLGEKGEN